MSVLPAQRVRAQDALAVVVAGLDGAAFDEGLSEDRPRGDGRRRSWLCLFALNDMCRFDRRPGRLGPVAVLASFQVVLAHLAFHDSRVGP